MFLLLWACAVSYKAVHNGFYLLHFSSADEETECILTILLHFRTFFFSEPVPCPIRWPRKTEYAKASNRLSFPKDYEKNLTYLDCFFLLTHNPPSSLYFVPYYKPRPSVLRFMICSSLPSLRNAQFGSLPDAVLKSSVCLHLNPWQAPWKYCLMFVFRPISPQSWLSPEAKKYSAERCKVKPTDHWEPHWNGSLMS